MPARSANAVEVAPPSRAATGSTDDPSMNSVCIDRSSGSIGDQAVPVVALVVAGGPRLGRVGLGPREQALEERPLAEHAAGRPGPRTARRARRRSGRRPYESLQAAGAGADDDDRVLARAGTDASGAGSATRSAPPAVRVAEPTRLGLEHPVHDPGCADQEALDRRARDRDAAQGRHRDDVGGRRLAEQDRDLAEEVAAVERRRASCRRSATSASPSRIT